MDTTTFDTTKNKAQDLANEAATRLDAGRESVANTLQNTAETLRHRAGEGNGRLQSVAQKTADGLASAADYTRNHNFNDVWSDFSSFVRRHPAESIACALFLGVIAGRSWKRE